jgi:hypothetical protein
LAKAPETQVLSFSYCPEFRKESLGNDQWRQGFSKDVFIEASQSRPDSARRGRTISLGVSVEAVEQFQVETSGTG